MRAASKAIAENDFSALKAACAKIENKSAV
jgi:hypothetical protein